ncbi:hypothetical protein [Embleya sp. AB8]|uniref:hypothetical protein n=1 Tax=Embleya sp. AB8 TaxID=3156304 RepID=UPI003C759B38
MTSDSLSPDPVVHLRYARVVADGLVFAYALDMPTGVRILTDADQERAGLEAPGGAAYGNLMRVPVEHSEVPVEGRALLHSVYGDSPFVVSKALYLGEPARQVTGEPPPDAGALVVVPTRHLPAYHQITDGSAAAAVNWPIAIESADYADTLVRGAALADLPAARRRRPSPAIRRSQR